MDQYSWHETLASQVRLVKLSELGDTAQATLVQSKEYSFVLIHSIQDNMTQEDITGRSLISKQQ